MGSFSGKTVKRGDFTFEVCDVLYRHEALLVSYDGDEETVTVPETVDGCPVEVQGPVFVGKQNLRQLIFEPRVTMHFSEHGAEWPFRDCPALETVLLPDRLIWGESVFPAVTGCPRLKSVDVRPDNVWHAGKNGCIYTRQAEGGWKLVFCTGGREKITIPGRVGGRRVRTVHLEAFSGCEKIKQLVIGEGIIELLGDIRFEVETIRLPNSFTDPMVGWLSSLHSKTFRHFTVKPDHPAFVEEDGYLYDRSGGTLIFAPRGMEVCRVKEGVHTIGRYAFCSHENLKAVFLPGSVRRIETEAFCMCQSLYYVSMPAGVTVEEDAFMPGRRLFGLVTPEGVQPLPLSEGVRRQIGSELLSVGTFGEELLQMHKDICRMGFEEYDRQAEKPCWLIDFFREEQPEEKIEYDASDFVSMENDEYSMYDEEFDIDFDEIP